MSNLIVEKFEESGMSVSEFARRADLKYSTAHDIATGKANPENIGAGAFIRIAQVFGTTSDALSSAMFDFVEEKEDKDTSADDEELLSIFHRMDDGQQTALLAVAYAIVEGR